MFDVAFLLSSWEFMLYLCVCWGVCGGIWLLRVVWADFVNWGVNWVVDVEVVCVLFKSSRS
jgi:hypothetical protein